MSKSKDEQEWEFTGHLDEAGTGIEFEHPHVVKKMIGYMQDKRLLIKVSILRFKRSDAQNRYIHGVVVPCVAAWWKETQGERLTHTMIYTWLRVGLLGVKPVEKTILGKKVIDLEGKRFSQMNTKEFAESVDTIIKKMDEKGCFIPLPRKDNLLTDFEVEDK